MNDAISARIWPAPIRTTSQDIVRQMQDVQNFKQEVNATIDDLLAQYDYQPPRGPKMTKAEKEQMEAIDKARLSAHLTFSRLASSAVEDCALILKADASLNTIHQKSVYDAVRCSRHLRDISIFANSAFGGHSFAPSEAEESAQWIASAAKDAKLLERLHTLLNWQSRRSSVREALNMDEDHAFLVGPPTSSAISFAKTVVDQLSLAATKAIGTIGQGQKSGYISSAERQRREALQELSERGSKFCATMELVFQELYPAYDPHLAKDWPILDHFVKLDSDLSAAGYHLEDVTLESVDLTNRYLSSIRKAVGRYPSCAKPHSVLQASRRILGCSGGTAASTDHSTREDLVSVISLTAPPNKDVISFHDWISNVQVRHKERTEAAEAASKGSSALMRLPRSDTSVEPWSRVPGSVDTREDTDEMA